eukprot:4230053-Amphidinium_carterae.4
MTTQSGKASQHSRTGGLRDQCSEEDGMGPFFCLGVGTGELGDTTEFNRKWIIEQFSDPAHTDAFAYLDIWNTWMETSVQGRPATPIGINVNDFSQNERHREDLELGATLPEVAVAERPDHQQFNVSALAAILNL